jgi:hypothetical protein
LNQLSHYFGFCSFKNRDTLYNVCQQNFSFLKPTDKPLELAHAANIKKARSNKTPIDCQRDILEVVHCGIGYSDSKAISNEASCCLLFIERATRYVDLFPKNSPPYNYQESYFSIISQWSLDAGLFLKILYTDFDPKILDNPTGSFL